MSTAPSVAAAAAPAAATPAAAPKAPGPTTAFDALLAARGLPLVATAAEATGLEATEGTDAEPTKGEPVDDEIGDCNSLMGLWLQWMRPIPSPTPEDGAAMAADATAPLLETTAGPKKAQQPAVLMPLDLLQPAPDAEPLTQAGPDALGATLADMQPIAAASTLNPASFAAVIDVAAANPMPAVLPIDTPMNLVQSPTSSASTPSPAPAPAVIDTQQADWTLQLGERIAGSLDEQHDAIIELHPAELGSLNVRVEMRGNDAQVTIVAASAAARDLLQQSLPQLRELLSVQGLNLARAQVERSSASQNGHQAQGDGGTRERGSGLRSRRQVGSLLLVDAYA